MADAVATFCLCIWNLLTFASLLKEKFFEKKYPDEIKVAECKAENGYDQANDETEESALLRPGGPSYQYLGDPVYTGNEKKNKLDESALFVKPSHFFLPPFFSMIYYIISLRFCKTVFVVFTDCLQFCELGLQYSVHALYLPVL